MRTNLFIRICPLVILSSFLFSCKSVTHPNEEKTITEDEDKTRFNIRSRPEEVGKHVVTVDVGSCDIEKNTKHDVVHLKAGERAVTTEEGVEVVQVNEKKSADWVRLMFVFNHTPLEEGLERIAKWYHVKLEESYPKVELNGEVSKELPLSNVLEKLEEMCDYQFMVEEGVIRIK